MGTGKGKKDPASAKKSSSSSKPVFKPAHLHRILRDRTKMRVSNKAIIATSTLLEYLLSEIVNVAKEICDEEHKKKIISKHISMAIRKDEELNTFGKKWVIKEGGVCPTNFADSGAKGKDKDRQKGAQ
ncbi:histone H2A [Nematocida sp. AWRm77]|nr:histone H2A [Nematocida sp. AWRm77]